MADNPSLKDLVEIFKGTLEEEVVSGVFHDMHGNGREAIQILRQLQSSMGIPKSGPACDLQETNRGSKKVEVSARKVHTNFKISNSVRDRRLNPDRVRIPGYHDKRALYIMRGLSGSGKSTYAKKIISELGKGEIFSTDDFFMLNEANEYRFVPADLEIAHKWNQQRVEGALSEGMSPVIVDNTNTQFWEMRPYVITGVECGYNCYFIEPPTEWKFKVNQLYRKSKHGLNKGQLVAALKRYEKNPTVEKVIGPAYLSKMKHLHCAGESSIAAGYIPFTSVDNDTSGKKEKTDAPLVPYILSDSSDEPCDREKSAEKQDYPQNQEASTSIKYRDYNNNSTCPKVINQPPVSRAVWDSGSGNLGMSGIKPKQTIHQSDSQKNDPNDPTWGEKSGFSDEGCEGNDDWDQDMSAWLADMEAREIEDDLLEKLEKQQSAEVDDYLNEVIDIHKLREESVKRLSTWHNVNDEEMGLPQGCINGGSRGQVSKGDDFEIGITTEVFENDIPDLEMSDSENESDEVVLGNCNNRGRITCEHDIIYVSKVYSLAEICRKKLKTLLKVSYHNSTAYWNTHKEAKQLETLRCSRDLPPPSPQPDPQIMSPSPDHIVSLDLLEPYLVVSEDHTSLSPSTRKPVKESTEKFVLQEIESEEDPVILETESKIAEERLLSSEQMETIKTIENIIGTMERSRLISVCDDCEWDQEEILECLLLKESLREITEETIREESVNLKKLIQNEPPSIRTLLKMDEDTTQSGSDADKGEESEISSNSTASKTRYDSKDDVEVATLTLPPKVVKSLTDMFGQIVGLPSDKNIKIPVNTELASLLHSALYFAHIDGKTAAANKGKEKRRPMKLPKMAPPVISAASAVPFSEIVQYQSKLPERKGKMKKLVAAYPGMDEHFLEDVLSSCGNDLQRALNALSTKSVHLRYLDDEENLYSSKTEYTPERVRKQNVEYTQITQSPQPNTYSGNNIIIPPGTLVEQAEAFRELSGHNLNQAKLWHSKKKGLVAGHYAKQGAKYRNLAEEAEMKLFDGTIVKDRLRDLKMNPVIDLHGFTLTQSKYLLNEATNHFNHMIGQDPEYPRTLTVITGKGLHSSGGTPRLKLGIKALLNTLALPYNEEPDGYKIKFRS